MRVLLVEDSETDATLLEREPRRSGFEPQVGRVDTSEAFDWIVEQDRWEQLAETMRAKVRDNDRASEPRSLAR